MLPVTPFFGVLAGLLPAPLPIMNGIPVLMFNATLPPVPVPAALADIEPLTNTVAPERLNCPPLPVPTALAVRSPEVTLTGPAVADKVRSPPFPPPRGENCKLLEEVTLMPPTPVL